MNEHSQQKEKNNLRDEVEKIVKDIVKSELSGQYGGHTIASLRKHQENESETEITNPSNHPKEISENHLPTIMQNLNAIRSTAESATHAIMNATENIQALLGMVDERLEQQIRKELTLVVQACAFQDITGQQMTRIIDSIEEIEFSVDGILAAMGDKEATRRYKEMKAQRKKEKTQGKNKFSGPQNIIVKDKQAEIDSIFEN